MKKGADILRFFLKPLAFDGMQSPYVVDEDDTLALHFDHGHVQSLMRKGAPEELMLGYTRSMMGFLLLQPAPRDILMVGLGGGSLAKFCYKFFPECRITVVEISAAVINLRERFEVPADDARLRIVHADAVDYLAANKQLADVILLDGFDEVGLPSALASADFYASCRRNLTQAGILVVNLWGQSTLVGGCLQRLRSQFDGRLLRLRAENSENRIAIASCASAPEPLGVLRARARELQLKMGLNFPWFLDQMRAGAGIAAGDANWFVGGF